MWVRIVRDSGFTACLVPSVLTDYRINTQVSASMNFPQFTRNAELAAARIEREIPRCRAQWCDVGSQRPTGLPVRKHWGLAIEHRRFA